VEVALSANGVLAWERAIAGNVRFDGAALHHALDMQRRGRGLSWQAVADEIGVSASTIARSTDRRPMETDGVVAMVRWLGYPLEAFSETNYHLMPLEMKPPGPGRLDTRALHDAINVRRQKLGMTWQALAEELGVAAGQLTYLAKGGRIAVGMLMAILLWLEMPSGEFVRDFSRRSETARLR